MGAFIYYLHLAHGINNFFVLAPNLTIYNKLIADFTAGTPKCLFKGIAEFATELPDVKTGKQVGHSAGAGDLRNGGGKPWKYALIAHDQVATNMTIAGLVEKADIRR